MDEAKQQRTIMAEYSSRYRNRRKQGQPTRQRRTPAEQLVLLQQPYTELSEKEKTLVRYYRRQARKQSHRVASSIASSHPLLTTRPVLPLLILPPQYEHSSSISSSQPSLETHPVPSPIISSQTKECSPSLESSHSSSDAEPSSKRQHVAEILSSLSQLLQQPSSNVANITETKASVAIREPATSSSQSVVTTVTSMSVSQNDEVPVPLPSDLIGTSPPASEENDHKNKPRYPLLDDQEFKRNGLPYNKWFEVRNSTVCDGLGLFTRPGVTIESKTHIAYYGGDLLTADDVQEQYGDSVSRYVMLICGNHYRDARDDLASLGRYINTNLNSNARIIPCVGDSKAGRYSARYESTSRIGPSTEIIGTYGPSGSRAARGHAVSVSSSPCSVPRVLRSRPRRVSLSFRCSTSSSTSIRLCPCIATEYWLILCLCCTC